MPANFNDADRYLIDRWTDARDMEEGIRAVRTKYQQVLDDAACQLQEESWWEADFQSYANESYGCLGFGRAGWGGKKSNFPGFWLDDLDLDYLTARTERHPFSSLWLGRIRTDGLNLEAMKHDILKRGEKVLSDFPARSGERDLTIIRYGFPESREELVKAVLLDGAKPFIEILLGHANRLAALIPVVDEVLTQRRVTQS